MNCSVCGINATLLFPQPDGSSRCAGCLEKTGETENSPAVVSIPEDTRCHIHPGVSAVRFCQRCQKPICKTCDFSFPNNIHVCPHCVNKPQSISPRQKKSLVLSYIMAAIATLVYLSRSLLMQALGPQLSIRLAGLIFMSFTLGPSIAGFSFAINARTRNRKKTLSIWIALIWNSLVMGIFLLLLLIGLFMRSEMTR